MFDAMLAGAGIAALILGVLLVRARARIRALEALQRVGPLTLAGVAPEMKQAAHEGWAAVFQQMIYSAHDIFWETDHEHRFQRLLHRDPASASDEFSALLNHAPWEPPSVGVAPEAWDKLKDDMRQHRPFHDFIAGRIDRTGILRYSSMSGVPVFGDNGEFSGYRGASRDYTAIQQTQVQLEIRDSITRILAGANRLSEALPEILKAVCQPLGWCFGARWMRDARNNTLVCGETWATTPALPMAEASRAKRFPVNEYGVVSRAWTSQSLTNLSDVLQEPGYARHDAAAQSGLRAAFAFPVVVQGEVVCVLEFLGANVQQSDELIQSLASSIGNQIALFWLRREAEARLTYAATHDPLTGLRNRLAFNNELERAITRAKRNQWRMALMFIDLDGFKQVNDRLGHQTGDTLLIEVGKRLKNALRSSDTLARMGGDEFVVLLEQTGTDGEIAEVAHKLLGVIRTPYPTLDGESPVSASFGVAIFPVDAQEQQALLAHADSAMYRAKTSVENRVVFYRPPAADVADHNRKLDVAAAIDAAKGALRATEPPADL